ncbi:MAG: prepilin-type N-terminal cleavage/methylation domain-containing protein [Pseudomonas sp.]|nr:MAG: prepilin-type N-terminal cleavage/methylation domain-containing protein [Pseudomonas sp.]
MPSHRTTLHPSRHQGFTLIELMIVLAIIAIVALVAAPDYQSSIASSRKTSAANNLLGALQFARSEALTRRSDVTVCASSNGSTCSGSDWSTGGVVLDGSTLLRSIPAAPKVAISGNAITIKSDGTTTASSISVDDKTVSINIVGHAKIN